MTKRCPSPRATLRPLGTAALLAAALGGGSAPTAAQTPGHAGHVPAPSVNLGSVAPDGSSASPSIVHTGHEALYGVVLVDKLEWRGGNGTNIAAWEGQALYGTDYNKIRINTRGEYSDKARAFERAEVQVLYSRLIGYFFDAQIGIRQDLPIRPQQGTPARTHLAIGIQGLLPNLLELNLQGFVSQRGTLAARLTASYDAYITQRLVLQPEFEVNFAANSDVRARIGSGLTRLETGLRLRYEFTREVAPYIGVSYERVAGETANIYRRFGERREYLAATAGVRLFF